MIRAHDTFALGFWAAVGRFSTGTVSMSGRSDGPVLAEQRPLVASLIGPISNFDQRSLYDS